MSFVPLRGAPPRQRSGRASNYALKLSAARPPRRPLAWHAALAPWRGYFRGSVTPSSARLQLNAIRYTAT